MILEQSHKSSAGPSGTASNPAHSYTKVYLQHIGIVLVRSTILSDVLVSERVTRIA